MRKQKMIGFRVTYEEYELLRLMAKRERRGNSEMLREIIREAAEERQFFPAGLVNLEKYRSEDDRNPKAYN